MLKSLTRSKIVYIAPIWGTLSAVLGTLYIVFSVRFASEQVFPLLAVIFGFVLVVIAIVVSIHGKVVGAIEEFLGNYEENQPIESSLAQEAFRQAVNAPLTYYLIVLGFAGMVTLGAVFSVIFGIVPDGTVKQSIVVLLGGGLATVLAAVITFLRVESRSQGIIAKISEVIPDLSFDGSGIRRLGVRQKMMLTFFSTILIFVILLLSTVYFQLIPILPQNFSDIGESTFRELIIISFIGLIIFFSITFLFSYNITNSLSHTIKELKRAVDNRGKKRRIPMYTSDEISSISYWINQLLTIFGKMNESVEQAVIFITDSAQNLSDSSQELSESLTEVSELSTIASHDAQKQLEKTQSTISVLRGFEQNFEELGRTFSEISRSITRVNSIAQEKITDIRASMEGLKEVVEGVNASVEKTRDLQSASESIEEIIETITMVTNQTNLLALNASIEAARAGEAGRGFSVIAEEIRNLSGETTQSSARIAENVSAIRTQVDGIVEDMSESGERVRYLTVNTADMEDKLKDIMSANTHVTDALKDAQQVFDIQQEAVSEILSKAKSAGEVSQHHEKISVQLAETIREQKTALNGLTLLSKTLLESSKELQIMLESLTLSDRKV